MKTFKKNDNERRGFCHNELGYPDYTYKDAIRDLDEAIKLAWNTRNGNPQCTYRDEEK